MLVFTKRSLFNSFNTLITIIEENPKVAVEFARKAIGEHDRPSFADMESACKSTKNPGAAA